MGSGMPTLTLILALNLTLTLRCMYATISGPVNITMTNVEVLQISAHTPQTGVTKFTDSLLLQLIQDATVNSQQSNLQDIPTDCAHRDERLGWMGDASLATEQVIQAIGY